WKNHFASSWCIIVYQRITAPMDDEITVPFQGAADFDPLINDDAPAGSEVVFPDPPGVGQIEMLGDGTFRYIAPPNFAGDVVVEYLLESDGCTTGMATITFLVGKDADCGAPNIFTPNNDGFNDFFVVPCLLNLDDFPQSRVTIFNQWGDEVYRSETPYRGDWDGRYNGDDLPVGTYFYYIEFGNDRATESGHVRIQR
ncbi:MAG: gliding motility-associated C-terminal domain-containing protein, partial [Bacteroidota bacterium]